VQDVEAKSIFSSDINMCFILVPNNICSMNDHENYKLSLIEKFTFNYLFEMDLFNHWHSHSED